MERRVAASERLAGAGEAAAKVAHELNTPLDGVLRYIGLAERAEKDGVAEHLAKARSGLMRMADIIRELAEQGRAGLGPGQKVAAERLLDEALSVMQPRAQALGVTVVCDLAGGDSPVVAGLFQVFCNVVKNALDAMPKGGRLLVRMRLAAGALTTAFHDSGVGMRPEDAERVFEPFYTTKPPGEGVGLGLSICREIVARMGGTISAAPRPEGGTVVTVCVPVSAPRPQAAPT
jgi:signal transduction histidine kinase